MWQIPLNMSTANLPLLTQISLGICSADDRHSPEKLEHKCAENAQPMLEKYRPQLCQGWQNQQQQLQPLWCQTYCTQHPFVQCFQTSCQNPPEATALCQKWQGSRLSLKLVLWTPKAQLAARTSGAGRSECRACFSAPTNILQAALSWEAVLARFVFLELTGCSAGTAHPQVWEPQAPGGQGGPCSQQPLLATAQHKQIPVALCSRERGVNNVKALTLANFHWHWWVLEVGFFTKIYGFHFNTSVEFFPDSSWIFKLKVEKSLLKKNPRV